MYYDTVCILSPFYLNLQFLYFLLLTFQFPAQSLILYGDKTSIILLCTHQFLNNYVPSFPCPVIVLLNLQSMYIRAWLLGTLTSLSPVHEHKF